MRTFRHNGEYWYVDGRPLLQRVAEWIVWMGGLGVHRRHGRGERLTLSALAPVSFLGHRVTFYSRQWAQMRVRGGWLVVSWRTGDAYAFVSPDGTPQRAHTWLWGAPGDVRRAAEQRRATA